MSIVNGIICNCLGPLPKIFDKRTERKENLTLTMLAYAGDVTLIIITKDDEEKVEQIIKSFCGISGQKINQTKSSFLHLGGCMRGYTILGLTYKSKMKCLRMTVSNTLEEMIKDIFEAIINKIRRYNYQ